ncbi:hypothetical protein EJ06DRAFT_554892 [Trichodelitschia bisporula]|uniref:Uncharacterized protein n=1 Tax=Trichodelitschia bisporula TaxID=703511 RepID=A0A6G1I209_9PEZI|nr:hypothetical protein EJ06DRAFT_554892 [Trichodelitschia bisporula]
MLSPDATPTRYKSLKNGSNAPERPSHSSRTADDYQEGVQPLTSDLASPMSPELKRRDTVLRNALSGPPIEMCPQSFQQHAGCDSLETVVNAIEPAMNGVDHTAPGQAALSGSGTSEGQSAAKKSKKKRKRSKTSSIVGTGTRAPSPPTSGDGANKRQRLTADHDDERARFEPEVEDQPLQNVVQSPPVTAPATASATPDEPAADSVLHPSTADLPTTPGSPSGDSVDSDGIVDRTVPASSSKSGKRGRGNFSKGLGEGRGKTAKEGGFTDEELAKLDDAYRAYRIAHNLTTEELNAKIQDVARTAAAKIMFDELTVNVLPNRNKVQTTRVIRRRFHNYGKRGQWTKEEDQALLEAFDRHGRRWKDISELLKRHPEDCRDRWRNYLKCGESRNQGAWTAEEVELFRGIVHEILGKLRVKHQEDHPDETEPYDPVRELDWNIISERMGNRRSRLQCSNKWKKLSKAGKAAQASHEASEGTDGEQAANKSNDAINRQAQAKTNVNRMSAGDKYLILRTILRVLRKANVGDSTESDAVWEEVTHRLRDMPYELVDCRVLYDTMRAEFWKEQGGDDISILKFLIEHLRNSHSKEELSVNTSAGAVKAVRTKAKKRTRAQADSVYSESADSDAGDDWSEIKVAV